MINGEYFSISNGKEQMSSLAIPTEQLKKRFKWFYTYYIYTATYKELPDKGPVPLDKYLNKEEQIIWFRGDNAAFSGMNGIEHSENGTIAANTKLFGKSFANLPHKKVTRST